jgi:membrane protease YdiL (CAAX protease family)
MIGVVLASLVILPRVMAVPKSDSAFLEAYLRKPFAPIALLVLVALVAPLLEEFLFRGWIQRSLERRMLPWRAILITAVAFGVAHGDAFGLPLRVIFGVASGYAAYTTRSIWPSVVLHGAYNGSLVILSGAMPKVDERTLTGWAQNDQIFLIALGALAVSGSVLAAGAARDARCLGRRTGRARGAPPRHPRLSTQASTTRRVRTGSTRRGPRSILLWRPPVHERSRLRAASPLSPSSRLRR